jgi:hypothetical protein
MQAIHSILVTSHIVVGAVALVLFWVPVFAAKGSALHVRVGKIYAIAMYIVSITAFIASVMVLADPIGIRRPGMELDPDEIARLVERFRVGGLFLLMLSVLVFSSVHHGLMAIRERRTPGLLRRPIHRAMIISLGVLGAMVAVVGIMNSALLLIIFGGISVAASIGMFRESLAERLTRKDRIVAHLGGLLGSGIGAYTAFFAFGGVRFFADLLPGQWQVVSWVIAPVIGTIAISRLSRKYRQGNAQESLSRSTH